MSVAEAAIGARPSTHASTNRRTPIKRVVCIVTPQQLVGLQLRRWPFSYNSPTAFLRLIPSMANAPLARFPARMDSMTEIRTFVEAACATAGIGREDCLKVLLIVEELFTNTVTHGYREESESPVWIAFD